MRRMQALCAALFVALASPVGASEALPTTVIVNGRIVDGTGSPARSGALRIRGPRIVEVGNLAAQPGDTVVDASGGVIAPGFVDCHSHLDRNLQERPDSPAAITQGVTTVAFGADGFSSYPLSAFFAELERHPVAVNVASFSGHNTLRDRAMPDADDRRPARADEVSEMRTLLAEDMRAGSLGLSTGLAYETGVFSDTGEIIGVAKAAARAGGIHASHIRNESADVTRAIDELLEIGEAARIPVHVSHIKIAMMRLWGSAPLLVEQLDAARERGIDVSADVYPYARWQTTMRILFPNKRFDDPSGPTMNFRDTVLPRDLILQRFVPDPSLAGRDIAAIAAERNTDPVTLYMELMRSALDYEKAHPDTAGKIESVIGKGMDEEDIGTFMAWPRASICSDGADGGHPRGYGTFTRVLGRYVREQKVLSLEAAVHKMTGLTTDRLQMDDRGVLAPGAFADIVVFDPATVIDRATIDEPTATSRGIQLVIVNGEIAYRDGTMTGARPGRVVRRGRQ